MEKPVQIKFSLVSHSVMLGEPLFVAYDIENRSEEDRIIEWGRDHERITFDLVDEAGQSAPARPDPRTPQGGMYCPGARLTPGRHYRDFLVVTRELIVSRVGHYNLHVKARLSQILTDVPQQEHRETIVVQAQSFVLNVTPPDPARLRELDEKFRQAAVTRGDYLPQQTAIQALLSMPEQYALASWQALANEPHLHFRGTLMNELARVISAPAADLLAQLCQFNPGPLLLTTPCTALLDNMYRAADASLKQHIEQIFARYGKTVSEWPLMFPGA